MPYIHLVLALLTILIWGFNFVVIKIGVDGMPPIFLAFLRLFLVSIPAIFFLKKPNISIKKIILFGFVMFVMQFSFFFIGMSYGISAGLSSLLMQAQIVFSVIFAIVFFREWPHRWQIIGSIVAFSGIWLVGKNLGGDITMIGLILTVAAAAAWGMGNIVSKKIGKVNPAALIVWASFTAWPILLAFSFFWEGPEAIISAIKNLNILSVSCILYISYLGTFFCFVTWSWLLNQHKISHIAPFTFLTPIIALFASVLVLGERMYMWKIYVAILVLSGLSIDLFGPLLTAKKPSKEI